MKDSGIPWIGQIPEDWEVAKYKFFATSGMGETILGGNLVEDGIPVYSATQNNTVFGYVKSSSLKLNKNDFVIPARGNSIGCVTIVKDNEATATQTTIYSKLNDKINYKFLYYCCVGLKDVWFYFEDTAIPQITVNQVQNNKVPLPPKEIQQKIVEILDKKCGQIDELVRIEENEIEKLKEYKTSLITKVVTKGLDPNAKMKDSGIPWIGQIPEDWKIGRLKFYAQIKTGSTPPTNIKQYFDENINWFTPSDFKNMYLNNSERKIASSFLTDFNITLFPLKTTLLVGIGATCGKIALINNEGYCNQQITAIVASNNIDRKFMFYEMSAIQKYLKENALYTTLPILNNEYIKNINIIIADIEIQQQIVDYLDKRCEEIDNLIKIKQEKIEKLKEYKKSLIYQYVTGKKEVV